MGRILRKKDSQKTKKKKSADEGAAPQQNAETAAEPAAPAVMPDDKDTAKRQIAPQKKPLPAVKSSPRGAAGDFIEKALQFLREVKVELKKVVWPSRKQTVGSTVVVIILVMIISFFLGVVDVGLSNLVQLVFKQ